MSNYSNFDTDKINIGLSTKDDNIECVNTGNGFKFRHKESAKPVKDNKENCNCRYDFRDIVDGVKTYVSINNADIALATNILYVELEHHIYKNEKVLNNDNDNINTVLSNIMNNIHKCIRYIIDKYISNTDKYRCKLNIDRNMLRIYEYIYHDEYHFYSSSIRNDIKLIQDIYNISDDDIHFKKAFEFINYFIDAFDKSHPIDK